MILKFRIIIVGSLLLGKGMRCPVFVSISIVIVRKECFSTGK
jgi:hypothetical protein